MESNRGFVCAKHNEYSHIGICRWCEPAIATAPRPLVVTGPPVQCEGMNDVLGSGAYQRCADVAAWLWTTKDTPLTNTLYFCGQCHDSRKHRAAESGWNLTPIGSDPGNATPKGAP